MESVPEIALDAFVLSVFENESSNFLLHATFNLTFIRNDQQIGESGPIMQNDNGCPMADFRLIVPAIDILIVNISNADNHLKLGSVYLDLEDILQPCGDSLYTEVVMMESDNSPGMQLTFKVKTITPSSTPPAIWSTFISSVLDIEESTDSQLETYLAIMLELASDFAIISEPEQYLKLQNSCVAFGGSRNRLTALATLAFHFDCEFRATSEEKSYNTSRWLYRRLAADVGDLERPVQLDINSALTSLPDTLYMQSFSNFLLARYSTTHNEVDLQRSISLLEAVNQLRAGPCFGDLDLDHFRMYCAMAGAYGYLYDLSDKASHLDMVVELLSKAVKLTLPWWASNQHRAAVVMLSYGLLQRFMDLSMKNDLKRALEVLDEALAFTTLDDPVHRSCLQVHGLLLAAGSLYSMDTGEFGQSINILEELLAPGGVRADNSDCSQKLLQACLLIFRLSFLSRSDLDVHNRRVEADLKQAIHLFRESDDNWSLIQLLIKLFARCWDNAALEEALTLSTRLSSDEHDIQLGEALLHRYEHRDFGGNPEDLRSAKSRLARAATSANFSPLEQVHAAQLLIACILELPASSENHIMLIQAHGTAMSLLPSVAWLGRPMQDRHDILMSTGPSPLLSSIKVRGKVMQSELYASISELPNLSACFAIGCGMLQTAIVWLEQGRSIIWEQLLQLRVPLDTVWQKNPPLARKLNTLAKELSKSSTKTDFGEMEAEAVKHRRLATEWQEAVAETRKVPGLDKFLLPKEFDYLCDAAEDAIVVIINSYPYPVALILFPGSARKDVLQVPLDLELDIFYVERMYDDLLSLIGDDMGIRSELTRRPIRRHFDSNISFKKILANLWYDIVLPIICAAMEYQPSLVNCDEGTSRAHVRWCPTGPLAFLPLHAAGDYSLSGKGHRVFDFVVSSYIPTLSSVIRPPPSSEDSAIKVLAVACPYVDGQIPIPDTEEEVTRVGRHVVPFLDQPESAVSRYIPLVKKSATADRVVEEMKDATWVHLACHGVQHATSPTESALLLSGGTRLSLSDIAALDLPQAEFAFLSACQTATGYDKIPSESVHLAAGMLLAGYRSVIATMWSIADRHAPHVADDVYGYLLRDGTARRPDYKESSLALHLAMERLRERIGEESFLAWVPYIHIGA